VTPGVAEVTIENPPTNLLDDGTLLALRALTEEIGAYG